jgi:hypothetical protein
VLRIGAGYDPDPLECQPARLSLPSRQEFALHGQVGQGSLVAATFMSGQQRRRGWRLRNWTDPLTEIARPGRPLGCALNYLN